MPKRACSARCPGVFGSLQAVEALKILLGLPGQLRSELLIIDLTTLETRRIRAASAAACRGRIAR